MSGVAGRQPEPAGRRSSRSMRAGPLRRLLGVLGLVALLPVVVRVLNGSMTPMDAAVRAVVTFAIIVFASTATVLAPSDTSARSPLLWLRTSW